jgi:hypothetical protein
MRIPSLSMPPVRRVPETERRRPELLLAPLFIAAMLAALTCLAQADTAHKVPGTVAMSPRGHFFEVIMEFNDFTHREMGFLYGKELVRLFPTLEAEYDASLAGSMDRQTYEHRMRELQCLKPQVPREYRDEIEAMASHFSGGTENVPGDGRLSVDELYYLNLYIDLIMTGACSSISVFGPSSANGKNIVARVVDWYPRKDHAVFTIRNQGKSIVNIGRLSSVMAGTAFNGEGVFAALLAADPSPGVDLQSERYRSVTMDIRYALENFHSSEEVAAFLSSQKYTFSHQVFLADPAKSGVLENNLTGGGRRALRGPSSSLGEGVPWDFSCAVAAVNSFFLEGNYRGGPLDPRWTSIRSQLARKLKDSQRGEVNQVTFEELKEIATYYDRSRPQHAPGSSLGDIYNSATQQIVLFEPDTLRLELFFPEANTLPIPDPAFTAISVSFSRARD